MALTVDEAWLKAYQQRTGHGMTENRATTSIEKRSKYGAEKTVNEEGTKFDSKHEAKCYELLRLECREGRYIALARQMTFWLPGGVKYIADFVTIDPDGVWTVWDAKSEATRKDKVFRLKKRQMRECLGIEVHEL